MKSEAKIWFDCYGFEYLKPTHLLRFVNHKVALACCGMYYRSSGGRIGQIAEGAKCNINDIAFSTSCY